MRPVSAPAMLDELQWHWGRAYAITGAAVTWLAQRRDNGRTLVAAHPDALRQLIIEDYLSAPVSRQAAP